MYNQGTKNLPCAKITNLLLWMVLLLAFTFVGNTKAQDKPKAIAESTTATTATPLTSIAIPSDLQTLIKQADLELSNAQLKRQNLDLQLRLLLKVPNEFTITSDNSKYEMVKPPAATNAANASSPSSTSSASSNETKKPSQ